MKNNILMFKLFVMEIWADIVYIWEEMMHNPGPVLGITYLVVFCGLMISGINCMDPKTGNVVVIGFMPSYGPAIAKYIFVFCSSFLAISLLGLISVILWQPCRYIRKCWREAYADYRIICGPKSKPVDKWDKQKNL